MNKINTYKFSRLLTEKKIFMAVLSLLIISAIVIICFVLNIKSTDSSSGSPDESAILATVDEQATMVPITNEPTYSQTQYNSVTTTVGRPEIIKLNHADTEKLIGFESNDTSIAEVDNGGRIDVLREGTAIITADFSDGTKYEYEVTAKPAEKSPYDGYSTCILANTDIENENINSFRHSYTYVLKVNRKMNCVTAYTYDKDDKYTIPVRSMVCSCGLNDGTITGSFDMYFKNEWLSLYGGVYGQYISGIDGDYLFHTVPYTQPERNSLEVDEYNKLGDFASLGCIRMSTADTKWVYDNCPVGTRVIIYDDDNAGPLGKPEPIRISDDSCGWDPTDDNIENPYNSKKPYLTGINDTTISKGSSFNPLEKVNAYDTCSNDITSRIEVIGNVITSKEGKYKVTYKITDAMHRSAESTITVTVE